MGTGHTNGMTIGFIAFCTLLLLNHCVNWKIHNVQWSRTGLDISASPHKKIIPCKHFNTGIRYPRLKLKYDICIIGKCRSPGTQAALTLLDSYTNFWTLLCLPLSSEVTTKSTGLPMTSLNSLANVVKLSCSRLFSWNSHFPCLSIRPRSAKTSMRASRCLPEMKSLRTIMTKEFNKDSQYFC